MFKPSLIAISLVALLSSASANAEIITFDDLAGADGGMPNGYAGFQWENFSYLNATDGYANTGYANGVVSAPNVVYNAWGNDASISRTGTFTLIGFDLTAAWNNDLNLKISGYANGELVDLLNTKLNTSGPTHFQLNWTNVDKITFHSFGGTSAGLSGAGVHFALDNLNVAAVPEPETYAMFLAGLGIMGAVMRRRKTPA